MSFELLRSKILDLFNGKDLTEKQKINSALNGITVLRSYPRRIVLELTNVCNLKCIMCGRNYANFKPTYFDVSFLDSMADVLQHCEEVTLFGWGEPTMPPKPSLSSPLGKHLGCLLEESALVAQSLMSFRLAMWPKQVHTMNSSLAADQPVGTRKVRSDRLIGVLL